MRRDYGLLNLMAAALIIFLVTGANISAQEKDLTAEEQASVERIKEKPLYGFFGISFTNCVPQGELMDNLNKSGQGFSLFGGYQLGDIPIAFGFEGDILFFGGETKYFSYSHAGWSFIRDTVVTQSSMYPLNFFIKVQPKILNLFFPYVEGIAGINLMSVDANYKSSVYPEDNKDRFDAAFNYGFGAGIMVKLVDFVQLPNTYSQLLFDVRMRYLKGSKGDYATVKIKSDSSVEFKDFETDTDMVLFLAGITFRF